MRAEPIAGPIPFGALVQRYRVAAGLSQEALAERAGLSRRGIADLERGARRFPYGNTLRRLADALGLAEPETRTFLAAGLRPRPSLVHGPVGLPIDSVRLVGRERELGELQELVRVERLVTLTGPGGIGKTRLALEVARQLEVGYDDLGVFVDLAPVTDPQLVPYAMARALGVREARDKPLIDTVQDHVGTRRLLVVLDNCEHVLADSARLADALVRNCPQLHLLVTSREAMRIHGETAWSVPPLKLDQACLLFGERARSAQANPPLNGRDSALIADICRRLDGIPLAIELAAARVPALGLVQIAAHLEERLRLLSVGSRLDAPRHQTLRAAVDWSYDLLSQPERRLFERLSVFAGGWSMHAAETVCGWAPLEGADVLGLLSGLVDKSLVIAEEHDGRMRYRFLETIREYALERDEVSGQAKNGCLRHAAYYRELAATGASTRLGVQYPRDIEVVTQEQANLRAALGAMLGQGELQHGLALCLALGGFWLGQGHLSEGLEWLEGFLKQEPALPWDTLADGLHTTGRIMEYRGAFELARSLYQRSLTISRSHDDATRAARAVGGLGDVAIHQGDYERAVTCLEEALSLGRTVGSLPEVTQALWSLARVANAQGDAERMKERCEEALLIQRRLGDRWGVAYSLHELGQLARREGQLDRAQALDEESHVLWRQSGSRMGERAALMSLAVLARERGSTTRAAAITLQILDLCREMVDPSATTVRCVEIASDVLLGVGSTEPAVILIAAATAQRAALGAPVPPQEQVEREGALSAAHAALETSGFERAWASGGRLSIPQAVELAAESLMPFVESGCP